MHTPINPERRSFFSKIANVFMAVGLFLGYGMFATLAARFLYPSRQRTKGWLYVAETKRMNLGDSLVYETPVGSKVAVARQHAGDKATDFIALSSTCPHLGCQVSWEGNKNRFFCPCHNGAFDPNGKAISGPPKDAKQSLSRYPLKVERGLLFIEVPLEHLEAYQKVQGPAGGFPGAHAQGGHL